MTLLVTIEARIVFKLLSHFRSWWGHRLVAYQATIPRGGLLSYAFGPRSPVVRPHLPQIGRICQELVVDFNN